MSEPTSGGEMPLTTISRVPSAPTVVGEESNITNNYPVPNPGLGFGNNVDGSDEENVQELHQTVTEKLTNVDRAVSPQNMRPSGSDITLSGFNAVDGFDLEKTLRHVVRK